MPWTLNTMPWMLNTKARTLNVYCDPTTCELTPLLTPASCVCARAPTRRLVGVCGEENSPRRGLPLLHRRRAPANGRVPLPRKGPITQEGSHYPGRIPGVLSASLPLLAQEDP
eukprot:1185075-Prorocentrum_minimum.AAC.1